jgi:hypothetical protein
MQSRDRWSRLFVARPCPVTEFTAIRVVPIQFPKSGDLGYRSGAANGAAIRRVRMVA